MSFWNFDANWNIDRLKKIIPKKDSGNDNNHPNDRGGKSFQETLNEYGKNFGDTFEHNKKGFFALDLVAAGLILAAGGGLVPASAALGLFLMLGNQLPGEASELDPAKDAKKKAGDCDGTVNDPIILDLNGDGIRTTSVNSGFYVDYAEDGLAEATAWANEDDGVLVIDNDGNSSIDNESELVKNLSAYDTNNDGVINSNDTNFANLQLLKGDGTLTTLSDAGVASIDLATNSSGTTDTNGNTQTYWGTYTNSDGVTRKYGEYELQANNASAVMSDVIEVSTEIEALPDASNYGTVYIDDFAKVA